MHGGPGLSTPRPAHALAGHVVSRRSAHTPKPPTLQLFVAASTWARDHGIAREYKRKFTFIVRGKLLARALIAMNMAVIMHGESYGRHARKP